MSKLSFGTAKTVNQTFVVVQTLFEKLIICKLYTLCICFIIYAFMLCIVLIL